MVEGIARGCAARVHAELAVNRAKVGLNGAAANNKLRGDLGIAQARRDEAQHLKFPPR